jgi:histidine phosphotransfer protein HptB
MSEPSDASRSARLIAAGVFDAQVLARLQELDPAGKGGLVARVLATYMQSLQRLLEQLRAARDTADLQGQRHVAHTLKSSSASVGALKLSALCADIERRLRDAANEGPAEDLAEHLDSLAEEGRVVLAALLQSERPRP